MSQPLDRVHAPADGQAVTELDAFVSYSHRDEEFVDRLRDALRDRGRTIWVDADSIPPGAPWREELGTAIEAATVFLFVMSPESVASPECRKELARAGEIGKRMVSIELRSTRDVPAELAVTQWVSASDGEPIERVADDVVRAIDTDHDWTREHTQWLARALRWEEHDHERSRLLRGRELDAAEAWLARQGEGKRPPPTALQTEFIGAGRRDERRRLRRTIAATAAALAVAIVLAVLALIQRGIALDERDRATSRALAASAVSQLSVDPELSLLLGLEARKVDESPEAADALRQALAESHVRIVMREGEGSVSRAAYSPDGALVATAGEDGTVRLWDAATGTLRAEMEGHDGWARRLIFAPEGGQLVTGGDDGTVRVWNPQDGSQERELDAGGRVDALDVSDQGDRALAVTEYGVVRVWDLANGRELPVADDATGVASASFSADGRRIVTGHNVAETTVWPLGGGLPRSYGDRPFTEPQYPMSFAEFTPDGQHLVTASDDGTVEVFEVASGRRTGRLRGAFSVAVSPDSRLLATTSINGQAQIWTLPRGEPLSTLVGHAGVPQRVAFDPASTLVVTGGLDGTARVWEGRTGRSVVVLRGHRGAVNAVDFAPGGRRVLTGAADGTARIWDVESIVLRGHGDANLPLVERQADVRDAEFSPDGRDVLTVAGDGTARLWDSRTGTERHALPGCPDTPPSQFSCLTVAIMLAHGLSKLRDATISPDGELVAAVDEGGAGDVWRMDDGTQVSRLEGHEAQVYTVEFSPDSASVVTASEDGTARVWRVRDGRELQVLRGHEESVNDAAFVAGGREVVTGGEDGTVRRWRVADGSEIESRRSPDGSVLALAVGAGGRIALTAEQLIRVWRLEGPGEVVLRGHDGLIADLAFDASGRLLASAGLDLTARVWDAASGRPVTVLRGHTREVHGIGFDTGARRVVTSSEDGTARIWTCDPCVTDAELVERAEERTTRPLTAGERARYVDGG